MKEVTVVIPNYNGMAYIKQCLLSLQRQNFQKFDTIVVDNASTDKSEKLVENEFEYVRLIRLKKNYGFSKAVNVGIENSETPYVILLNNDTEVAADFVEQLLIGIRSSKRIFSCSAKMLQYYDKSRIDDAGDYYCALGWAYARGKGRHKDCYQKADRIFASCAGAAIYRKKIFEEIGYFDEAHFAYLEDIDIGYRARIYGYQNLFCPAAVVFHVGSGTSGSKYNEFKVSLASRNSIYIIYKNMPFFQIILNFPLLFTGFLIKYLFFVKKNMGKEYARGIREGFSGLKTCKRVAYHHKNIKNYMLIQLELWWNIVRKMIC